MPKISPLTVPGSIAPVSPLFLETLNQNLTKTFMLQINVMLFGLVLKPELFLFFGHSPGFLW